jgi:hypothetical protein
MGIYRACYTLATHILGNQVKKFTYWHYYRDRLYLADLLRFQTASGRDPLFAIPIFRASVFCILSAGVLVTAFSRVKINAANRDLNKVLSLSLVYMFFSLATVRESVID